MEVEVRVGKFQKLESVSLLYGVGQSECMELPSVPLTLNTL